MQCADKCRQQMRTVGARVIGWGCIVLVLACGGNSTPPACRVNAECASGLCRADGTCAPAAQDAAAETSGDATTRFRGSETGSADTAGSDTVTAATDAAKTTGEVAQNPDATPDSGGDGVSGEVVAGCVPNHDGVVTRAELPLGPGLTAPYTVALNTKVDLQPQTKDGKNTWDFGTFADEKPSQLVTVDPKTQWFGKYFPTASYAVQLLSTKPLLGVFRLTDTSLDLLGAVSPQESLLGTRITYDPPLPMMQFPLKNGAKWTAKAAASGTVDGVLLLWSESIEMTVAYDGILTTKLGNFPVLAVQGRVDKVFGLSTTTYRSMAFVTECYGVVGKADSDANEAKPLFTNAAEVRRMGP